MLLGVVEVCLGRDAVLHNTELVVHACSFGFTLDPSEIIFLCGAHDHDLPLLSVQGHSSVLRVPVGFTCFLVTLLLWLGSDQHLVFIGHRFNNTLQNVWLVLSYVV